MITAPAIPSHWRDLPVYWDWDFRLLICQSCGFALGPNQASSHLWEKHEIPLEQRRGLTEYLRQQNFQEPAGISPRPRGAPEHPALRTYSGLACRLCATYCTVNLDNLLKHLRHQHPNRPRPTRQAVDQHYDDVYLQTWNRQPYWIISRGGRTLRPAKERSTYDHLQALQDRERTRHAALQAAAVQDTGTATRSFESLRPWIERTGWDQTYDGLHRALLQRLTEMPDPRDGDQDHRLRSSPGAPDLVSPAADERVIWRIAHAVDSMLDRCEETMRHTGRPILCWLRTFQPSPCYPKPFVSLARSASTSRYRRTWKRFIVFLFRCFRLGAEVCRDQLRIKFRRKQLEVLRSIWSLASDHNVSASIRRDTLHPTSSPSQQRDGHTDPMSDLDEAGDSDEDDHDQDHQERDRQDDTESDIQDDDTDDTDYDAPDGAEAAESTDDFGTRTALLLPLHGLEQLFQLNIIFLTDEFTDGQPSSSLLVYFSGILGFSPDARSFQPARSFTPHLSALIYIQRLLFLEYALPYRDYPTVGWSRRPRRHHFDRLNPIRTRYMVAGALTPLAEFQSLRDYGRKIALTDPPSFLLRWSEDGQTVTFRGGSLQMVTFRRLAWYFLDEAEKLCEDLLLDYRPSIDLGSVRDDLVNLSRGFSFVQHPKNRLKDAYLELANRACTYRQHHLFHDGQWNLQSVSKYIERDERLRKLLMGVLYTTGGQVPRIPELSSLECVNGPFTERGFYVWNGSMIYLTRHHKAKRSTNREFFVARFLPARGGRLLYQYLVYIRPFVRMLEDEMTGSELGAREEYNGSHIFCPRWHGPPWASSHFLAILNRATEEAWKQPVTTQQYRQLAIGITEKHVREVFEPFNRHDDRTAAADLNVVFAWQSGHRPVQRNRTYGLDGAFPNQLQPALLRAYEWASTRWHEFLGLASKHRQSSGSTNEAPSLPPEPLIPSRVEKSSAELLASQTTETPATQALPASRQATTDDQSHITDVSSSQSGVRGKKRIAQEITDERNAIRPRRSQGCASSESEHAIPDGFTLHLDDFTKNGPLAPCSNSEQSCYPSSRVAINANSRCVSMTALPIVERIFEYEPVHRVMICRLCQYVVFEGQLPQHLRGPRHTREQHSKHISSFQQYFQQFPERIRHYNNIVFPQNPIPPISGLITPKHPTYQCRYPGCHWIGETPGRIRGHCRQEHGWKNPQSRGRPSSQAPDSPVLDMPWDVVASQQFTPRGRGSQRFAVQMDETTIPTAVPQKAMKQEIMRREQQIEEAERTRHER